MGVPTGVTGSGTREYTLLEQIPMSSNTVGSLSTYLQDIYIFAFWVVALAVVFMLTVGGFMYLTAAGNTARMGSAKTVIFDALLGLVLALVAWLFLYMINPDLVNVRLPSIGITPMQAPPEPPPMPFIPSEANWPSDATERSALPSNITVNHANCTKPGESGCTSLAGSTAISALRDLGSACGGCSIIVTGGTECWLHGSRKYPCNPSTHHQPGDDATDIGKSSALDSYIKTGTVICNLTKGPVYRTGNSVYYDEGDHWHANFNQSSCSSI